MKATDLSLQALERCDEIFGHLHMWKQVQVAMRPIIEQENVIRDSIVIDQLTATNFVTSVIARYLEQQIETGTFHISRGVLGHHGKSLRTMAETALAYLEQHRAISRDSYLFRIEQLENAVRNSG